NRHIIDIMENDDLWRQAKVDLSQFAGSKDLRLRFVFSSAGGDIGLGTSVGRVAGTLITAPTADLILDGRSNNVPGDGSLRITDSYYTIDGKTFQFVNGYSLYVPVTPGAYGNLSNDNTLTLTINGTEVQIPLDPAASAEQILNRIITAINNQGILDSHEQVVTVKRYLDVYGKPSGQMLSFENAETLTSNITNFLVLGGEQDRTLENIFEMSTAELVTFLSQNTIPVPFRADMTQAEIAGSITFMTNLAFNDLLWSEINQVTNSDEVYPLVEALLERIQTMGPTENIINIINDALGMIRPTGSTKAISYLEALVEKLNVNGKINITDGGINYTSLNRELERLYSEAANLAVAALRSLRGNLPFNPNAQQNTALDTAQSRLLTCITNGMFPNRQDSTRIDPITILQDVLPAFGGNNANEQFVRDGINAILASLTSYYTFHRVAQLEAFLSSLPGRIPTNIFAEFDAQIQQLRNAETLSYALFIAGDQNNSSLNTLWNQLYGAGAPVEIRDMITQARIDILADPESMYLILQQLLIDIPLTYSELFAPTALDRLDAMYAGLEAAGVAQNILDMVTVAHDAIDADPQTVPASLQQLVASITALQASNDRTLALNANLANNGFDGAQAILTAYNNTLNNGLAVNGVRNIMNAVANYYLNIALVIADSQVNLPLRPTNLIVPPPHAIGQMDSLAFLRSELAQTSLSPLTDPRVLSLLSSYHNQIIAEPQNIFILLDELISDLDLLRIGSAAGATEAVTRVRIMRERASQMFSGDHVGDDMDILSVNIKRDAQTTAITDINALLRELNSHVTENAVDAINRVLHTSLSSTDPRELINLFYQNGQLLEKILRIDTSQVTGLYGTSISGNSTDGLKTLTNSIQMSLVNSLTVGAVGPLNVQTVALDGTRAEGLTAGNNNLLNPINRSRDNQYSGLYIDNIIVGFASRGDMVTNAPGNTNFEFTNGEEAFLPQGSYQLEIRRGTEYAAFAQGYLGAADATIWNLFNVNERHANGISFFAPSSAEVAHNQKFSISDGVNTLTFVFINTKFGGGSGDDIRILFSDGDSNVTIANKIKDAINLAYKNGLFKVTATTGTQQANTSKAHSQVDLFNATDFLNLTGGSQFIKHVFFGTSPGKRGNDGTITGYNDNESVMQSTDLDAFLASTASRLYIDPQLLTRNGDTNTIREKGQLTLYGNNISYSSDYAIRLAPGDNPVAAARQQADFRSTSTLIPGIAVTNNVLAFNVGGGINITGLADVIPFVRIVNNTIYGDFGGAVGTGVSLGSNTAATLLNNIFSNLDTAVALNGANGNEIVYRANTYKGNNNNG
ncbi:MAG: right-handed parallel beta-helix repeat-containing protein, partial [Planctomycetaceae bacterium]|nr:right-handed parallel beta-helix repeat-containing protein [Planctomycetaceae bacterium]